ncbi:hypothetical protein GCM10010521_22870 [Streptomyces rameus]|uniref:Uncharacterized protein n=1 Tax=Streptomyces rameus TaxID=68261 RepID=A0ABP6N508_9ACTN
MAAGTVQVHQAPWHGPCGNDRKARGMARTRAEGGHAGSRHTCRRSRHGAVAATSPRRSPRIRRPRAQAIPACFKEARMGHDMYIHDPVTDEEEARYQKARKAFDAVVRECRPAAA